MEELLSDYATVLRQISGRQALIGSSSAKQIEELELENLKLQRMLTEKTHGIHMKEELKNIQPQGGMLQKKKISQAFFKQNKQKKMIKKCKHLTFLWARGSRSNSSHSNSRSTAIAPVPAPQPLEVSRALAME